VKIEIRPPRLPDWRACRMLLPECFRGAIAPEAFLAWDVERGAVAGAAAFHRHKRETVGMQLTTTQPYRRAGVGSRLLERVVERARERGDARIVAVADVVALPEAEPFLRSCGFEPGVWTLRLEGEIAPVRDTLLDLRERLISSGKAPRSARIVESRELPAERLRRWYEQTIAPALQGRPEFAAHILTAPGFDATVLLVDDTPVGMLAGIRNDGDGCATLRAVAIDPQFRGGWGWANALLLASGVERAWNAGSRRVRFETEERNWRVLQTASRAKATVVAKSIWFSRTV
jgi:GNAT superfamily N-acetyltransferase